MTEYERMAQNFATLKFLRKHTILSPKSLIKIERAKDLAENFHKWYLTMEHEDLGIDYSNAERLEFELRFNEWQKSCVDAWQQYGTNMSLGDFSKRMLEGSMAEEAKKKATKKKIKKWN